MPRFHEPFSLYARSMQDGRRVWYYRTYVDGVRTPGKSTGLLNKGEARRYCLELFKTDRLTPSRDPTFATFAAPWWKWAEGKAPTCPYCRAKLERSPEGRPGIARRFVLDQRRITEHMLLPYFRGHRLSAITPQLIDRFILAEREKGYAPKTVNGHVSTLRTMISEAVREGLLPRSPFLQVRLLSAPPRERGTFTLEETRALFADGNTVTVWGGNDLARTANQLAACTGLRQGEVLGLRGIDVHPDHVEVAHSWCCRLGTLEPTKTRRSRVVPIPAKVAEALARRADPEHVEAYLFAEEPGGLPVDGPRLLRALRSALSRIGVSREEQERRNLMFHSWRHTVATWTRGAGIPDAIVGKITGHADAAMLRLYGEHFSLADFGGFAALQGQLFEATPEATAAVPALAIPGGNGNTAN